VARAEPKPAPFARAPKDRISLLPKDVPAELFYSFRQMLDDIMVWYDEVFGPEEFKDIAALVETEDKQQPASGTPASQVQNWNCPTPRNPGLPTKTNPIVGTPWNQLLFSYLDADEKKLVSTFDTYPALPLTLWSGDPAPDAKQVKIVGGTLFGKLIKKFWPDDVRGVCNYPQWLTPIWAAASDFFVQAHPQPRLDVSYRQSQYNKQVDTIMWNTELCAYIRHTQKHCKVLRNAIPASQFQTVADTDSGKLAGGDITIFAETTTQCKAREQLDDALDAYLTPGTCDDLGGTPCTDPCQCQTYKDIKDKLDQALGNDCQDIYQIKCKNVDEAPGYNEFSGFCCGLQPGDTFNYIGKDGVVYRVSGVIEICEDGKVHANSGVPKFHRQEYSCKRLTSLPEGSTTR
jgi:hypothetical protein